MSKRMDIKKILVIGSGPIIIGQAAEFDYSGTQACQSLKEEGYEVVLVNSNPATIMTDKGIADKTYIEPLTVEFISRIIALERPDAILGTFGGQTGLNLVVELHKSKVLEKNNVEILGTTLEAIEKAEDREKFKNLMIELNEPIPDSTIVHSVEEAKKFANEIGYPVVVRPAFTLGGTGGGFARDDNELKEITKNGIKLSPVGQCLIEKSIAGFKEIEYEVMRDSGDNAIIVCSMENVDPVGIHTGDSVVVAPNQTLTIDEENKLRNTAIKIVKALKINGGCNVQLALNSQTHEYYVIEVNPRVSRSSALASKATGYPIAKIAAKTAVGMLLDEIVNEDTNISYANKEPNVEYIVCKLPRFAFDKFESADRRLGTQMKATGEVMSIGHSFEEALLKAVRSIELKTDHLELPNLPNTEEELYEKIKFRDSERLFAIMKYLRLGFDVDKVYELTKIDKFFLEKLINIKKLEEIADKKDENTLKILKENGFSDSYIARKWKMKESQINEMRKNQGIMPAFKKVDTIGADFSRKNPYLYSTYMGENESVASNRDKVIVLGSGPIRIGQGVEFDYSTVNCVKTIKELGYEAIVINNNPETVSTDFTISDKLYFEPLTIEDVMNIVEIENPIGIIVQFGGQTAINLAEELQNRGVKILGTSLENIDNAEDRNKFESKLRQLNIPQPKGKTAFTVEQAKEIANEITYPVLVRPSYVLGGRAMEIVKNEEDLEKYMKEAIKEITHDSPILVDKYIVGKEVEVDAISDGETVVIPGIMEHIERAGVHSGDSFSVYPTQTLSQNVREKVIDYTIKIGKGFNFIGLFNIQFIVDNEEKVYVLEVNPRSSRTVPFLSKITNVKMSNAATKAIMGRSLYNQGFKEGLIKESNRVFVKAPVFSFSKLRSVDTMLGPEMKSTGEVMGSDVVLEKALYKAMLASGIKVPNYGSVLLTVSDQDKTDIFEIAKRLNLIGYGIYATSGTHEYLKENGVYSKEVSKINEEDDNVLDIIIKGNVDFVINTISHNKKSSNDGFLIRRVSAENSIPCFTSLDTAKALLKIIESQSFNILSMNDI